MEKQKFIEAGKIVNTHGVRGEVKIMPWLDSAEFLCGFKTIYIDEKPVKMTGAKPHKGCVIAGLEGVCDVNAAMALKNKLIFIDRQDAKLPEGGYFLVDIIGKPVRDEAGNELGKLVDIMERPASDIYVVKSDGGREYLIPAVPEFVISASPENGLVVRLIEGM